MSHEAAMNVEDANISAIIQSCDIVRAYVGHNAISQADLPALIRSTHAAVLGLFGATPSEPAIPIKRRFTDTHVICLDDGKAFRSMKRHLAKLGMTPAEYRKKWGLPENDPIVHPSYSAQRSQLAKNSGLGRKG